MSIKKSFDFILYKMYSYKNKGECMNKILIGLTFVITLLISGQSMAHYDSNKIDESAMKEADFLLSVFAVDDNDYRKSIIQRYFTIDGIRDIQFDSMEQISSFFKNEEGILKKSLGLNEKEKTILYYYYNLRIEQEVMALSKKEKNYKRIHSFKDKCYNHPSRYSQIDDIKRDDVEREVRRLLNEKGDRGLVWDGKENEDMRDMKYGETKIIKTEQQD